MKILIAEDDPGIGDVLEYSLSNAGHHVWRTALGRDAIQLSQGFDFLVLDIGLPDMDGFDVCREIRKSSNMPVIFLTSRGDEIDRVVGLELGADDYLTKPFSPRELIARIKAVARRTTVTPPAETDLILDRPMFSARFAGKELELSRTEFELLDCLFGQPGRVFTREQILDAAWVDGGCVTDRTVDAHIKSLRRKLAPHDCIETVRGVGYRFKAL